MVCSILLRERRLIYVTTIMFLLILSHLVMVEQKTIPYVYTVATPFFFLIRFVTFRQRQQLCYFWDLCYIVSVLWMVFIWATPGQATYFQTLFVLSNAYVLWIMVAIPLPLVFHDCSKITGVYFHLFPGTLSYVLRWYPEKCSKLWWSDFPAPGAFKYCHHWVWIFFIPFLFAFFNQVLSYAVVEHILQQPPEYMTMYRYLVNRETTRLHKWCRVYGERHKWIMYQLFGNSVALVPIMCASICYRFHFIHSFVLIMFFMKAIFHASANLNANVSNGPVVVHQNGHGHPVGNGPVAVAAADDVDDAQAAADHPHNG